MMKRYLPILVVAILLVGGLGVRGENSRIKVVCTLQVFSTMVKDIGRDLVEVDYIVPQGTDIHDYSLTQEDIKKINSANLIVLASSEFFSIDAKIKSLYHGELLDFPDYNATLYPLGDMERNVHGYWLYPQNAINISRAIYLKLGKILPQYREYLVENYLSFKDGVEDVERYIEELSQENDLKNKTALLAVPGVYYIVRSVGMKIAGTIVEGPNKFISPQEISEIEERIREGTVCCIVNAVGLENSRAGNIARQISHDTGVKILYVDIFSADNYTTLLLRDAAILNSVDYLDVYSTGTCDYLPYLYAIFSLMVATVVFAYLAYGYRRELMK